MVSVRRVVPVLLLVIATTALAQKGSSSQPPRDLHLVGDHWTAYTPPDPSTYPPGAKTHLIKAGDTLWDLAQQYFGNAYLWPQLWESNTWIKDAHWIYPGDTLLVEGEGVTRVEAETEAQAPLNAVTPRASTTTPSDQPFTAEATPEGVPVAKMEKASNPIPLASESDIYCYGYIGDPDEPMPNSIESFESVDTKYVPRYKDYAFSASAAPGDLIYIDGGTATGLVAGETYLAVEPGDMVVHPATGVVLGRRYNYTGKIRILCTDEGRSRGIVVEACSEISVGARLKPIPQLPIPIARIPQMASWCDPPSGRTSGFIVDSRGWSLGLVEGNLVQIDLGRDDSIEPGDFLTVFRASPIENQPRQILGQIGVLTTESHTATGIILSARREMLVGDQVEVR